MPYILQKFKTIKGKKINDFLKDDIDIDFTLSLKLLEKGKITDENNRRLQKNETLKCNFIYIIIFKPQTKNLKPLFQNEHFAIFDKPSGLIVHPTTNQIGLYTLLDEIQYQFGHKANLVNRIDAQTSGLILISKNKYSEMILKNMFEEKEYIKKYLAFVKGEIKEKIEINTPISNSQGKIKIKMEINKNGKDSKTIINPISYNKSKNQSLVEAIPYTGRQHQIRVHLDSIGHNIIGDPIYGIDEKTCDLILRDKIDEKSRINILKSDRLMLHSNYLEFEFLDIRYKIVSKQSFIS